FAMLLRLPTSTLFPYTTLFRSERCDLGAGCLEHCTRGVVLGLRRRIGGQHLLLSPEREFVLTQARLLRIAIGARTPQRRLGALRSEEHTSELQSRENLVCRLLL